MAERRYPLRTCIGCRRVAGPAEFVRLAARPDGEIVAGRTEPGRGAWLCGTGAITAAFGSGVPQKAHSGCAQSSCFDMAVRRNALRRALRREVGVYVIDRLRRDLVPAAGGVPDL